METISVQDRNARFRAVQERDRAEEQEFNTDNLLRNASFLSHIGELNVEALTNWRAEMESLVVTPKDAEWLEFLSQEFGTANKKAEVKMEHCIVEQYRRNIMLHRVETKRSGVGFVKKFLAGEQTLQRLEALIAERTAIRARSLADFFAKKRGLLSTAESDFKKRIVETSETFTRIFAHAVN